MEPWLYRDVTISSLSYEILPHHQDNTYEVRLIVDGADWIGTDHLGLAPPDLVRQLTEGHEGHLTIGRSDCGCMGCDNVSVLPPAFTAVSLISRRGSLLFPSVSLVKFAILPIFLESQKDTFVKDVAFKYSMSIIGYFPKFRPLQLVRSKLDQLKRCSSGFSAPPVNCI
jgi:hypothetical protein